MRGNPGRLVGLPDGTLGITRNKTLPIGGKVIVELFDKEFKPILEDGKQKTILCLPEELTMLGYVD